MKNSGNNKKMLDNLGKADAKGVLRKSEKAQVPPLKYGAGAEKLNGGRLRICPSTPAKPAYGSAELLIAGACAKKAKDGFPIRLIIVDAETHKEVAYYEKLGAGHRSRV